MPRLRLFAGLRDLAGAGSTEIEGSTVDDVVAAAVARYGDRFADQLARARIWVNGEEADGETPVGPDDEVALIPPVSGGAGVIAAESGVGIDVLAPLSAVVVLIVANVFGSDAWWAAAVTGFVALWAADVASVASARARDIPLAPVLVTIVAAVSIVWTLGAAGLGLVMVAGVVLPLAWSVASDSSRVLPALSSAVLMSLVAGGAVGSLVLARTSFVPSGEIIGVLLAIMLVSVLLGALVERLSHLPFGDPFSATALAAIVTALVAASIWDLDLVVFLIVGLFVAASLIAGRGLGSMLRTRRVVLVERSPGMMTLVDGVVLAALLYAPVLSLVG